MSGGNPSAAGIALFLCGDSIFQHPLDADGHPARRALADIALGCDLGISNLEGNLGNYEDWPAFVAGQGRGTTYMLAPPEVLDDLLAMGIRAVFTSNNHSVDFGEQGVLRTIGHLDGRGIGHAGTGASLSEATSGCVVETPAGTVALIGASDWGPRGLTDLTFPWPMGVLAADADDRFCARPGQNLLRYRAVSHVDRRALAELRRISESMGWEGTKLVRNHGGGRSEPVYATSVFDQEVDDDRTFHFMGRTFVEDDSFFFETEPFSEDLDRNCEAVRRAKEVADYVVVGIHQQGASRSESTPPDHTVAFARAAIDVGADLFAAHGRARAGGVEIYAGKPIIYGLPGFVNHTDYVPHVPAEQKRRWAIPDAAPAADFIARRQAAESEGRTAIGVGSGGFLPMVVVVAAMGPDGGELRYHPFELNHRGAESELGEPRLLGPGEMAERTLQMVGDRVRALGTGFDLDGGVGVVRYGLPARAR